eukprot:g4099.t1
MYLTICLRNFTTLVPQKTTKEILRENKRMIKRAIRELNRERKAMERQEKQTIAEIKKNAKANQIDAVKIGARDLVRTRNFIKKFIKMESQMNTVSMQLQLMKSTEAMQSAMKGVTKAMVRMNKQLKMPKMRKIMMEFMKQNEMMDMKQEMTEEHLDMALEGEDDDVEEERIIGQVLDEIGIQFDSTVPMAPDKVPDSGDKVGAKSDERPAALPVGAGGVMPSGGGGGDDADVDDLQARLNNLKK